MDEQGLEEFRRRWQEELAQAQALRKRRRPETAERRPRRPDVAAGRGEQASGYLALAQGLLEGAGRPPAARASRAERPDAASRSRSPPVREGAGGGEQLVDQLIRDLVSGGRRPMQSPGPGRPRPYPELQDNFLWGHRLQKKKKERKK
jgi:F-box/WD-40 domain protein 8